MKLFKDPEKETKSKIVATEVNHELVGLEAFMEKYPNNATTPLVYFENGMAPVSSPFTSIIELSKTIAEHDPAVIQRFVDANAYGSLDSFVTARRSSILTQFKARCNFLSRSLIVNVEQNIMKAVCQACGSSHIYINSMVEENTRRLASGFYNCVTDPNFSDTSDVNADFLTTYSFNTTTIPGLIAEFYDKYDSVIIYAVSNYVSSKESAEEIHMEILGKILPVFEMLKSQMEWLNYMLRSEAETIYRPMAMLPAEDILNDIYNTKSVNVLYRNIITAALDEGDFDKAKSVLDLANKDGIDTGIEMTTFDYRSEEEKLQDRMIEAAKENPKIKTTIF